MSELETEFETLLELLRPAKDRTEAIALMRSKVLPRIARIVDQSRLQEMLALAVFVIPQLEVENTALEETAENILQTQLSKRVVSLIRARYQTRSESGKKAAVARHSQASHRRRLRWLSPKAPRKFTTRSLTSCNP